MTKPVENYLYFALTGTAGDGARDAVCYPASTFIAAQYASATTTTLKFEDNTANTIQGAETAKFATVVLTHPNISTNASIHMDVAKAVAKIANNPGRGKVITVVDTANGVIAEEFNNALSAVTCTSFAVTQ
jgi:RNA-splicing ligase RtcB